MPLEPKDTPQGRIGLAFARALIGGDYNAAQMMMSSSLQAELSPARLKENFESMIGNWGCTPNSVNFALEYVQVWDDWPDKAPTDVGEAYIAIVGETSDGIVAFVEAVTVLVAQEQTHLVIREIQWGRP